jgi:hypothetical protein
MLGISLAWLGIPRGGADLTEYCVVTTSKSGDGERDRICPTHKKLDGFQPLEQ